MLVEAVEVRCRRTAHSRADEERPARPTLVLPRWGVFRHHVRHRTTLADANTVLLFHPDEPYRVTHPTDDGDDCIALRFDPDVVADGLGIASESSRAWTLGPRAQRMLHSAAHEVVLAVDSFERDERALEILAIIGDARPLARNTRDAARIDAVRAHLAIDVGMSSSLAAIARDAGYSPFHLARRFRAYTGTSMHQYRLALRLATAAGALREGASNLTTLAHDLGFASPAHFSAAFRAAYGISPSARVR